MKCKRMICLIMSVVLVWGLSASSVVAFETLDEDLMEKESEANEKYNILLREWAYDEERIDDVNADFPDYYGGAYIDESKNLVIQVTSLNDEIRAYFDDLIELENVIFEVVEYSYENLKCEKEAIVEKMKSQEFDSFSLTGVGISFENNSVTAHVEPRSDTRSINNAEIKKEISSFENVDIIWGVGQDEPTLDVRPGAQLTVAGTHSGSVGFWARDSYGNLGIITTPHDVIKLGDTVKIGNSTFGTAQTPHYNSYVDAVFIERTSNSMNPSRQVTGTIYDVKSGTFTILAVGSSVCMVGGVTGAATGFVEDVNYTASYGLTNTVMTSIVAAKGDSGGIVAGGGTSTSKYIAGIVAGRNLSTGTMFYVKAGTILSHLNISIY